MHCHEMQTGNLVHVTLLTNTRQGSTRKGQHLWLRVLLTSGTHIDQWRQARCAGIFKYRLQDLPGSDCSSKLD